MQSHYSARSNKSYSQLHLGFHCSAIIIHWTLLPSWGSDWQKINIYSVDGLALNTRADLEGARAPKIFPNTIFFRKNIFRCTILQLKKRIWNISCLIYICVYYNNRILNISIQYVHINVCVYVCTQLRACLFGCLHAIWYPRFIFLSVKLFLPVNVSVQSSAHAVKVPQSASIIMENY